MTSFVREVLFSAGELGKEDIPSKVETLRKKVHDIKIEIRECLKNRYIDFVPQYTELGKLSGNLNNATSEVEVLINKIEKEIKPQICGSIGEFHGMLEQLKKINIISQTVSNLIEIHEYLEVAKDAMYRSKYLEAAEYIQKTQVVFGQQKEGFQKEVDIYFALKTDLYVTKEKIIYHLEEIWKQKVSISQTNNDKKYELTTKISFDKKSLEEIIDLLQALHILGHLQHLLKIFGKNFLKFACELIILQKTEIKPVNLNDNFTLHISVMKQELPLPSQVFDCLIKTFRFLYSSFFNLSVVSTDDSSCNKDDVVMSKFGKLVAEEFCSMLVEKCIKVAIPSQSAEMETFHEVVDMAMNFQNLLLEFGFLNSRENLLTEFIQNIDVLSANKMVQEILGRARNLMKQELHKTMTIGVEDHSSHSQLTASASSSIHISTGDLKEMARKKSGLSKATFSFPCCQISIFAKKLVELLYEVMQEAKNTAPTCSVRLFYTARNICELYCDVVPVYHKDEILNIPQQTAIHHNNCMYISHCLLTLGVQYECVLPASLPVTFVDLVPELRRIGTEAFLAQMRHQRQQLLQLLQEQAAFQNMAEDEGLIPKAEKSVRQCLCQLQLLKKVWADVLPVEVYYKAIGTLLNTCLEEIIIHITSMEDIAASSAAQLDSIFSIILKQAPDLFKVGAVDKSDIAHRYVRKWFKFQELQLVLGASMLDIVNRWADAKGPLATHFSADEVKHLIRALFQNTERRAAALSKIR